MRRVTSYAAFSLQRCVFVSERTLLVRVALDARCIAAGGKPCLLEFETTMRIVAITALHRAFENLVMERHIECGLHLTMTTHTKLRLTDFQHVQRCEAGLFGICRSHARDRTRDILIGCG